MTRKYSEASSLAFPLHIPHSFETITSMNLFDQATPIVHQSIKFAKVEYKKNDSKHQWEHVEDVMKRASEIVEKLQEDVDHELLTLAVIFHDIDYHSKESFEENYKNHVESSMQVAEAFLRKNNYPEKRVQKVKQIMFEHSSPHRQKFGEAKTVEGKIIFDSDKSIGFVTPEFHEKYFPLLYLAETKQLVIEKPSLARE